MEINEEKLKQKLTPEEYAVLREKATESPFSGKYLEPPKDGVYRCKVCNSALFKAVQQESATKSPPGLQGWPSFNDALPGAIKLQPDDSQGMHRTEVVCAKCGSHLGHFFDDTGTATGKHYCINSVCLNFENTNEPPR
jgi:peptide-methionine (R)-S-oxide reductase